MTHLPDFNNPAEPLESILRIRYEIEQMMDFGDVPPQEVINWYDESTAFLRLMEISSEKYALHKRD